MGIIMLNGIQYGGGGGSEITYTVLSDTTQTTNAWVNPIIVSCNPLDYDVIIFDISNAGGDKFYCITYPQTMPLDSGDGRNCRHYGLEGNFIAFPARFADGMGMFTATNATLNVNKVTGIKFGGGSSGGGISYSTQEQNTGIKWIDGKYIYTTTISFTLSAGSAYTRIDTNINADNIIKYEGCGVHLEGTDRYMIQFTPYKNPPFTDFSVACLLNVSQNGNIFIDYRATTDVAGETAYITLYYTKEAS